MLVLAVLFLVGILFGLLIAEIDMRVLHDMRYWYPEGISKWQKPRMNDHGRRWRAS